MAQRKIIVTHVESMVIQRLLKADKGTTPIQDLIDAIVSESKVQPWIAEKFAAAWRYHHRDGNSTEDTQPKQAQQEQYYVTSTLPVRALSDPAKGTGIVAQIIALAEEGKSTQEIIAMGYNKSTVYRQYGEWKKRKAATAKA